MKAETSFYHPFFPTYVYEPYTTQFRVLKNFKFIATNPFFVTKNSMGTGQQIPAHQNVEDFTYPISPKTVWDMIEEYSDLVNLVPLRKYGSRRSTKNASKENGKLDFYGVYSYPADKYKQYRAEALKKYNVQEFPQNEGTANNEAREKLVNHLKYEWDGNINTGIKGLVNFMAQTRIAASYGLLQMLYATALKETNYPENQVPEALNETENINYAMQKLVNHLNELVYTEGKNNNFQLGLEESYKNYIWRKWNPGWSVYPEHVYNNVLIFYPIK